MNILAICGSLRKASYNRMMLETMAELAPPDVKLSVYDSLKEIPLFDGDDLARGIPAPVEKLREAIRSADGILFGSPEYNFSISGVLKNAIDWASRGADQPFNGKPFAIASASMGPLGGGRSQYDLRKVMLFLNAHALNKPEVFLGTAQSKFDASGRLTDEPTRKILADQVAALRDHVNWVTRAYGKS